MKWTPKLRNLPFVVLALFIVLTGFSAVQLSRSTITAGADDPPPLESFSSLPESSSSQPEPIIVGSSPSSRPGANSSYSGSAQLARSAETGPVPLARNSNSSVPQASAEVLSRPREQLPAMVRPPQEPGPFARPPHPLMLGQQVVSPQRGSRPRPLRAILTPAEQELLAHLVFAEAAGEPYEGKVAVAAVVLNRLEHPQFPSTLEGVIFEHRAFEPVTRGVLWKKGTSPLAYRAVQDALRGEDPTNGALYFYNPKLVRPDNWIWTRKVVRVIGQHHFAI